MGPTVIPRWLGAAPYRVFGRLPRSVRHRVARLVSQRFTVGSSVVLVDGDRLLLVRHSYRRYWSTPGGFLEAGEQPVEAAVREIKEELGVDVEPLDQGVCLMHGRPHLDFTFKARLVDPTQVPTPQGPEIEAAEWFTLDALPPLDPECADVLRAAGILPNLHP